MARQDLFVVRRARGGRRRVLLALAMFAFMPIAAPQPAATADEVKAAYLQKFPGFITWPPSVFDDANAPVVIGVLGADGVYAELKRLAQGRTVQGRPITVRRLTRLGPDVADQVNVIFIGSGAQQGAGKTLAGLASKPVLVVTEANQGMPPGSMLNFLMVEGRVRFEASVAAAEQAGLKLSSRLIGVAENVVGGAQ